MLFFPLSLLVVAGFALSGAVQTDSDENCSSLDIKLKFYECRRKAPEPFSNSNPNSTTISGQAIRGIFTRYCSRTTPSMVQCFRNWTATQNCSGSEGLIQQVKSTSGLCNGTQPAGWLQGFLSRAQNLALSCVHRSRSSPFTCFGQQKPAGNLTLDGVLDCVVDKVQNVTSTCDKTSVFLKYIMPLMYMDLGDAPSAQKMEQLKNVTFSSSP